MRYVELRLELLSNREVDELLTDSEVYYMAESPVTDAIRNHFDPATLSRICFIPRQTLDELLARNRCD